jgi:glycosyltransferase involved in cell wall biosynthesis
VIALVHGLRNWGAVEEYVAAVARGLGDRAVLVYPEDARLLPFAELGVTTVRYPPRLLNSAPSLTRRLAGILRRLRPEIVHATDVFPPALVAARLAGVRRLVVTHHTPELPRRDNPLGRLWLRLSWWTRPSVIYTSEADRARDGREPSAVIPLGIELERFRAGRPVIDGRVVGNVARLAEQKGHRTLLGAAARLPDVRFVVAGDGELRSELERGAPANVEFLGHRDDVPDLLASFDVFAFPSRFEGLCLAVIEAQAAGIPVVATPVGGIRETVVDGETGFLVPVDDDAALAERISWCLGHPDETKRIAHEAQRRVQERFSLERMVAETLAFYDSIR